MGGAVASALSGSGYELAVYDCDPAKTAGYGSCACTDVLSAIKAADAVVLAVKPQQMNESLDVLKQHLPPDSLVVSIAAGVTTASIERQLGGNSRVVRCMPNLAAKVRRSVTAVCAGEHAQTIDLDLVRDIFSRIGTVVTVEESQIDAITAVSGSGPGYLFYLLTCFQKAAVKLGFTPEQAQELVYGTACGSMELANGEDFEELCRQVCSKGGTTEAGIAQFKAAGMEDVFVNVLSAASKRAGELSKT